MEFDWIAVLDAEEAGGPPFAQLSGDTDLAAQRIEAAISAAGGRQTAVGAALTKALRRKRPHESALKVLGQFRPKSQVQPKRIVVEDQTDQLSRRRALATLSSCVG